MTRERRRTSWFALVAILISCRLLASSARAEPESQPAPDGNAIAVPEPERPAPGPMTPEARAHYEEGLRLYGDRNFAGAIREFEAGFALDPRREFLFAEAQAYRLAGDCARAIPLYERFLGSGPSALHVDATRLALDRCARQPPKVSAAAPTPKPVTLPGPPPERPEPARWWRDPWAIAALGAGVVATGVGVGFVVASNRAANDANLISMKSTTPYSDFDQRWSTAGRRRTIGIVSLATGATLLAGGLIRFAVVRRRAGATSADPGATSVSLAPGPQSATLTWQVTY
ncbi:MAG TPA: hypothetical protein VGP07_18965 [Polyangia bacterium]|jgi:tetratricopeptide (TPR) repeat protein